MAPPGPETSSLATTPSPSDSSEAFGRPFIANPNLVDKLQSGKPLTPPDPATFYTPGEKGYNDYE